WDFKSFSKGPNDSSDFCVMSTLGASGLSCRAGSGSARDAVVGEGKTVGLGLTAPAAPAKTPKRASAKNSPTKRFRMRIS
ncbi:MAG: hypothetical protein Q8L28_01690, partial [bacterium]|nr:hypothetical protein [bacterium]